MHNPGTDHYGVVKWIICDVNGSLDKCLVFDKSKYTTFDVVR